MNYKLFSSLFLTSFIWADDDPVYFGPRDASAAPPLYGITPTLNFLPKINDIGGVVDVFEEGHSTEHEIDYYKVRVVQAYFGCTNGQEILVHKPNMRFPQYPEMMTYEFHPTNYSRIVLNVSSNFYGNFRSDEWNDPVEYWTITKIMPYYLTFGYTRSWWYLDYQNGEPYKHWTNAVQCVRLEPNEIKYYELLRDGMSSASNRVREDSFNDLKNLIRIASNELRQIMQEDPFFPAIFQDFLQEYVELREIINNWPPMDDFLGDD